METHNIFHALSPNTGPIEKNVDRSGSTRHVTVPHEISRFRDRGKKTGGSTSASASDKLKVIMSWQNWNTICQCTTQSASAQHSLPVHNTICQCTTQSASAQHILPVHNTVCQCTTQSDSAQHSLPVHNTISQCTTQSPSAQHNLPVPNVSEINQVTFGYEKRERIDKTSALCSHYGFVAKKA